MRNVKEYHHAGDSLKLSPFVPCTTFSSLSPSPFHSFSRSLSVSKHFLPSVAQSTGIKVAQKKLAAGHFGRTKNFSEESAGVERSEWNARQETIYGFECSAIGQGDAAMSQCRCNEFIAIL